MILTSDNFNPKDFGLSRNATPPMINVGYGGDGGWRMSVSSCILKSLKVKPGDILRIRYLYDQQNSKMGFTLVDDDDMAHNIRVIGDDACIQLDITKPVRFFVGKHARGKFPVVVDTDEKTVWWDLEGGDGIARESGNGGSTPPTST